VGTGWYSSTAAVAVQKQIPAGMKEQATATTNAGSSLRSEWKDKK
jgi:hypothetical protein